MPSAICQACNSFFALNNRAGRNTGRGHVGQRERSYAPAQYCSARCRKAASRERFRRGRDAIKPPVLTPTPSAVTERSKLPTWGGYSVLPDKTYPGMYRIRKPDGTLSDMLNVTRAKDALGGGPEIS
jgi:hypothetical protein